MTSTHTNRCVVITGANRGLGLELARQLTLRGEQVIGTARDPATAEALAALRTHALLRLDVGDTQSIRAFHSELNALDVRVDWLINNAGLNVTAFGGERESSHVLSADPEHVMGELRVNALGPMLVARGVAYLMNGGGVIVNVSSQLGSMEVGRIHLNDIGYNMSKAALNMVTVALAGKLGPRGITTISIHPGWVSTDMGGPDAPLTPKASVTAMLNTIDKLTSADNGTFLNWNGTEHPW